MVSGVCDGFIGNRIVARYGAAGQRGAERRRARRSRSTRPSRSSAWRWAPTAWATWPAWTSATPAASAARKPTPTAYIPIVADRLAEAGRFGQEDRRGLVQVRGRASATRSPIPAVDQMITDFRKERGITPRKVSDEEIVERAIFAMVNEGARILEEGIAQRASDIDIVYLNGYGFPAHRGGPMLYADQVGLPNVIRALKRSPPNRGRRREVLDAGAAAGEARRRRQDASTNLRRSRRTPDPAHQVPGARRGDALGHESIKEPS